MLDPSPGSSNDCYAGLEKITVARGSTKALFQSRRVGLDKKDGSQRERKNATKPDDGRVTKCRRASQLYGGKRHIPSDN